MNKMGTAGEILAGIKLHNNESATDWSRSLESDLSRSMAMETLIIRLYASARKEIPPDEALEIEVRLAMEDLKEIPDQDLAFVFREAQIQAGGFVPTNGLIVKIWRGNGVKSFDDAAKAIRDRNNAYYLGFDKANLPTQEERDANAKAASEISRQLAGKNKMGVV